MGSIHGHTRFDHIYTIYVSIYILILCLIYISTIIPNFPPVSGLCSGSNFKHIYIVEHVGYCKITRVLFAPCFHLLQEVAVFLSSVRLLQPPILNTCSLFSKGKAFFSICPVLIDHMAHRERGNRGGEQRGGTEGGTEREGRKGAEERDRKKGREEREGRKGGKKGREEREGREGGKSRRRKRPLRESIGTFREGGREEREGRDGGKRAREEGKEDTSRDS